MSFNFPINPSLNQTYSVGDKTWTYDGRGWKLSTLQFSVTPIYDHANGAFDKANSANSLAQAAFDAANNAGSSAEIQVISAHANGAFDKANSANILAQNAYDSGNATYTYTSSSYGHANGAFDKANSANSLAQAAFDAANNAGSSEEVQVIFAHANAAFDKANSANNLAQAAYDYANNDITSISTTAGTYGSTTIVPVISIVANGRVLSVSNTAIAFPVTSVAGATGAVSNTQLLDGIETVDGAGSGLDADLLDGLQGSSYANSTFAQASFDQANSANVLAQNAYNFANTRYSSSGGTISGDVQISGNLIVVGNTVTYSANDVIVNDPILLIANNNSDNVLDIGFSAHYVESTILKHTGLIRDVSTSTWYLFEGYEPDIQGANVLNIADPSLVISTLKANINSQSVIVKGQDVLEKSNAAFDKANTDVTSISTIAGTYGNNTVVPVITLEANGRISSITNVSISGIGGGTLTWVKKTSNYTANVGDRIIADTSAGSFTITLPATPTVGSSVTIADGNNWYTNNITVARNGSTIEGLSEDLILDIEGIQVDILYDGATWEVFAFTGSSAYPNPANNSGKLLTNNGNTTVWSSITETYINSSFGHANGAFNRANSANVLAQAAFNAANSISGITTATPNTLVQRDSFGDIYANNLYANNLVSTSDIRFKNDIQDIHNPIEILNRLNGVSFKWINTDTKSYGLIAQELEKVMPELVSTTNDTKSVMYIPIIAILIEAIKQQQKEIDEIKNGKT